MNSSLILIGSLIGVGLVKSNFGGLNRQDDIKKHIRSILLNTPKDEYFSISKIAKMANISEFNARKALIKMKREGLVWEDFGLFQVK